MTTYLHGKAERTRRTGCVDEVGSAKRGRSITAPHVPVATGHFSTRPCRTPSATESGPPQARHSWAESGKVRAPLRLGLLPAGSSSRARDPGTPYFLQGVARQWGPFGGRGGLIPAGTFLAPNTLVRRTTPRSGLNAPVGVRLQPGAFCA